MKRLFGRTETARPCAALRLAFLLAVIGIACESADIEAPLKPLTKEERIQAEALAEKAHKAFQAALEAAEGAKPGESLTDAVQEKFDAAVERHEELVDRFPAAPLGEILFRLGTLRKRLGDFEGAHEAFAEILDRFPGSRRYPDAIDEELDIAIAFLEGKSRTVLGIPNLRGGSGLGAEILEKILDAAPFSRHAPEALYRLGNHHLGDREFDEAVVYFETLVRRFPDHPEYPVRAEFQAARAYFLKFNGLDYNLTPLEEALHRFEAFIEIHAEDPSDDTRALVGLPRNAGGKDAASSGAHAWVEQIRDLLAEKNYDIGQWYRRRSYPRAARQYYRFTQAQYHDTPWAEKAGKRLQDLGPDEPSK